MSSVSLSVPPQEVQSLCESGQVSQEIITIHFEEPNQTCAWNSNGNLGPKDGFFQARIEQDVSFSLPQNSVLCDMEFQMQQQNMHYDDTFLISFNDVVIASAFNWGSQLNSNQFGYMEYDWSKMAGTNWHSNFNKEGVFCAGDSSGLANCSWPGHDQQGQINLNYHPTVIQNIMSLDVNRTEHEFKFVTVGDNDNLDCEHDPVTFSVQLSYVSK